MGLVKWFRSLFRRSKQREKQNTRRSYAVMDSQKDNNNQKTSANTADQSSSSVQHPGRAYVPRHGKHRPETNTHQSQPQHVDRKMISLLMVKRNGEAINLVISRGQRYTKYYRASKFNEKSAIGEQQAHKPKRDQLLQNETEEGKLTFEQVSNELETQVLETQKLSDLAVSDTDDKGEDANKYIPEQNQLVESPITSELVASYSPESNVINSQENEIVYELNQLESELTTLIVNDKIIKTGRQTTEQQNSNTDCKPDAGIDKFHKEENLLAGRINELRSDNCSDWPIGRLLAFGAETYDIEQLKQEGVFEFGELPSYEDIVSTRVGENVGNSIRLDWLEKCGQEQWDDAYQLCVSWKDMLRMHPKGWNAEFLYDMRFKEEEICQKLKVEPDAMIQEKKALYNSINQWINQNRNVLSFLFYDEAIDDTVAQMFFGERALSIIHRAIKTDIENNDIYIPDDENTQLVDIDDSCANEKHAVIQVDSGQEVVTERTSVFDDWQLLKDYLRAQFRQQPLIGSIEIFNSEFELLMQDFKMRYQTFLNSDDRDSFSDEILCIELVQIAIHDYKDGAYWPNVADRLNLPKVTITMQKLGRVFVNTMLVFGKTTFDSGIYVESILMHSFACNDCIPNLYSFLYKYYQLDLDCNIQMADVESLFATMTRGDYFTRQQLIFQQTLDVIRYFPEISKQRFEMYLDWIDQAYWKESYIPKGNSRFVDIFKQWRSENPDFSGTAVKASGRVNKANHRFATPYLLWDTHSGNFELILPPQLISFEKDHDVHWMVTNCGTERYDCQLVEGFSCYRTQEIRTLFCSEMLLEEFRFELVASGDVIRSFIIQKDCYRAFDESGTCVMSMHLTAGVVYCFTTDKEMLKTNATCVSEPFGDLTLCRYKFDDGMIIHFPDGTATMIGNEPEEGLYGSEPIDNAYIENEKGDQYEIYTQVPNLLLKTTQEHFDFGRLSINGKFYGLRTIIYEQFDLQDRSDNKGYSVKLPISITNDLCFYISIEIPQERYSRTYKFAYLPGFSYRFETNEEPLPYLFAPKGSITLQYPKILQGKDMERHPNKNEFGFEIDAERENLCFSFPDHSEILKISIPLICYRFGNHAWSIKAPEDIWYSELEDSIDFRTQKRDITLSLDASADRNQHDITFHRSQDSTIIHCDLMALRSWLTRDIAFHTLSVKIGGYTRQFATIFTKSIVVSSRLEGDFENQIIHGKFDIIGRSKYDVSLYYEDNMILEHAPIVDGTMNVQTELRSGDYEVVIYEVIDDSFGFGSQKYIIGKVSISMIDPGNITGKTFNLQAIKTLEGEACNLPLKHKRYWIDVKLRREDGENRYDGILRIIDPVRSYDPRPVLVIVPDRNVMGQCQILFYDDVEEQPFLYDFVTKEIVEKERGNLHRMAKYRRYTMLDHDDIFAVIYARTEG